jgi:hypothetical protein
MPRWAIVLTVAPLVLCLGCGIAGFVVVRKGAEEIVPEIRDNVSTAMAGALSGSVSRRIESRARAAGGIGNVEELVLRPSDLSVNTDQIPGEAGVQTGTDGTHVYGTETRIGPGGITLLLPGATYSALPILADGRIVLIQIDHSGDMIELFFPDEAFAEAFEVGLNDALGDHGLTPVALMLGSGVMTIQVTPGSCIGGPGGLGACDPATPLPRAVRS